eukprot:COSAG01_NODE_1227_length_11135_cov_33.369337_5_plen_161_part_00
MRYTNGRCHFDAMGRLAQPNLSQCDVVESAIPLDPDSTIWDQPGNMGRKAARRYWVDGLDTMRTFTRPDGVPVAAICVGYFWYLTTSDTRRFCDALHHLRHYRAEDISFSQLFAGVGILMHDIRQEGENNHIPESIDATGCFELDLSRRESGPVPKRTRV